MELDKNHEYLQVKWFKGDQVPPEIDINIEESEDEIDWDTNALRRDDENLCVM